MGRKKRRKIRPRKCRCCGRWYTPRPQNASRQRYCSLPPCRRASHRASHRKWLRKNAGWHAGSANVQRVQTWRETHPGYWASAEHRDHIGIRITVIRGRGPRPEFRMRIENIRTCALRDFRLTQRYPGQSLASQLNRTLRETMAFRSRQRYSFSCESRKRPLPSAGWLEPA